MNGNLLKFGDIVKSLAGHDSGQFFMIVKVMENAAVIANGKSRKIEKPKTKKPMHLQRVGATGVEFAERFVKGTVTNAELYKQIAAVVNGETKGEK